MRGDHKRERDQEAGREMGNQREGQPERAEATRETEATSKRERGNE